jgi:hypothetical protein
LHGFSPFAQFPHYRAQGAAKFGQRVFHFGRNFGINLARDDAIAFQFAKLLGQHFLRGIRQEPSEFAKPLFAVHHMIEDDRFPFSANHLQGGTNGAIFKGHKILCAGGHQIVPTCANNFAD